MRTGTMTSAGRRIRHVWTRRQRRCVRRVLWDINHPKESELGFNLKTTMMTATVTLG